MRFGDTVRDNDISMAELQGYFMMHKNDMHSAVDDASMWVKLIKQQNKVMQ
eukprot:TRINITY_DN13235_c0_g1_i1.p2 TRINITY_DN13235_c0_g1~~TRINITY_DN13235_c0_g1_i1.p2  ORF type:complete len:51 (+),score=9.30 TRINITY_DN13235_c0_g1_i1:149-301(+)